MSPCEAGPARVVLSAEEVRARVGTALYVIELAAQVLEELPPPEAALPLGDRALYRCLQAAETARGWLVGHEAGDSVERPGGGSALGDGWRIYRWADEETARHFRNALEDWRER